MRGDKGNKQPEFTFEISEMAHSRVHEVAGGGGPYLPLMMRWYSSSI